MRYFCVLFTSVFYLVSSVDGSPAITISTIYTDAQTNERAAASNPSKLVLPELDELGDEIYFSDRGVAKSLYVLRLGLAMQGAVKGFERSFDRKEVSKKLKKDVENIKPFFISNDIIDDKVEEAIELAEMLAKNILSGTVRSIDYSVPGSRKVGRVETVLSYLGALISSPFELLAPMNMATAPSPGGLTLTAGGAQDFDFFSQIVRSEWLFR